MSDNKHEPLLSMLSGEELAEAYRRASDDESDEGVRSAGILRREIARRNHANQAKVKGKK